MRAIALVAVLLFCGSAAPAEDAADSITLATVTPVSPPKRSIMIYLKPTADMVDEPYPLRNKPYIVAESEVPLYRAGRRACDTVIQICRPRPDGSFLGPGASAEERRRHCGPLEPALPEACTAPEGGSFE